MIYIITHKIFESYFQEKKYYKILHVGNNDSFEEFYLRDCTGENISYKNKSFCELTGIYWIWKNAFEKEDDIVGIVHYRRYFTNRMGDFLYTYFSVKPQILSYEAIVRSLRKCDILLPRSEKIFRTVYQSYTDVHNEEDLQLTRIAIEKTDKDYLEAFDQVMQSHYYYYANMMICNKNTYDAYCRWLFSVLTTLEKLIDLDKYKDDYQRRVFGFLAERLLQVWVVKNDLKVIEYPVFNTETKRITFFQKNRNRVKKLIRKIIK